MSNETTQSNEPVETPVAIADEKSLLLQRARVMGLKVSNNIGIETLREKVHAALASDTRPVDSELAEEVGDENPPPAMAAYMLPKPPAKETEAQKRSRIQKEALKLIRIRITCLNPNKKDLPGEIYSVANRYIGTVRKYVPYGDGSMNGYHVPNCIYEHLKSCKFLSIRTKKGKHDGILVESVDAPEFAIEVLPQLTREELRKLAMQQAMAAGTSPE